MRLTKVTFTGVDERTDVKRLSRLQRKYPFAEFGVLLSYDWAENGNRFPDPKILASLNRLGLNLSAHFCGQAAQDLACGKRFKADNLLGRHIRIFHRCQLNLKAEGVFSYLRKLPPMAYIDEVIVQMRTPELCEQFLQGERPRFMSYLLDASGGTGMDTPIKIVNSPDTHIGYAGGIGPENVEEKLRFLLKHKSEERFWIDMETRVRTKDEWLDLDKVEQVLEICDKLIRKYNGSN